MKQPKGVTSPSPDVTYDRELLVDVIVNHQRTTIGRCHCGWNKMGASWARHVAEMYEAAVSRASA